MGAGGRGPQFGSWKDREGCKSGLAKSPSEFREFGLGGMPGSGTYTEQHPTGMILLARGDNPKRHCFSVVAQPCPGVSTELADNGH